MQTASSLSSALDTVAAEIATTSQVWQQCEGQEHLQAQVAAIALAHFLREGTAALQLIWADTELAGQG